MTDENPFGHWTTLEERLQELHHRLTAWWISEAEGKELKGVWDDAFRKFDNRLTELEEQGVDAVFDSAKEMLLECFEEALSDYDHILANFPAEPEDFEEG